MKTKITKLIPLALFMLTLTSLAGPNLPAFCLEFSLVTKLRTSYVTGCTVVLMEKDSVIEVLTQPSKGMRYSFCLKKNASYTIVVSCKGYHDRKVSISTFTKKELKPSVIYDMDAVVQMIPDETKMDEDFSDHPVALVEYVPEKDIFDIRQKYTNNYKKIVQLERRM